MEAILHNEVLKDLSCGSFCGLWGTVVSHPLDTIRIRLQLQWSFESRYNGILDWALKTIKREGIPGLYKGIVPPIVFQMPTYATIFGGKEFGNRLWNKYADFSYNTQSIVAGWIGGAISTVMSCPTELLKIRAQSNYSQKTDYFKLARRLIKRQGVSSLFKGYLCTLIRDVPAFAVYFGLFEIGCKYFIKPSDPLWRELFFQMIFASLAGIGSWVVTYPFDIIKTVIQTSDKHLTIREVFRENYKNVGMKYFFKGMGATSLRAIPMEATCLILYAQIRERI